ncbi:hypothetical protein BDF14DRAFT_64589 [Spinellus fusiger]|nr:hypothetical protein BDF14DRAFT_64589 [Spinellus fusiger]
MDFCTTTLPNASSSFDTLHSDTRSPTSLSLQELINTPASAESLLDRLTSDQISLIEQTIKNVKKRKLNAKTDKEQESVSQTSYPGKMTDSMENSTSNPHRQKQNINAGCLASTSTVTAPVAVPLLPKTLSEMTASTRIHALSPLDSLDPLSPLNPLNPLSPLNLMNPLSPLNSLNPLSSTFSPTVPSGVFSSTPVVTNEPTIQMKDGIEWVSFVYSHNRTLKQYSIRTDITHISLVGMDDKFKTDNCVYPRANLTKENYKGNRWGYETECNILGWKLALLNKNEISGKRGLIQRAVDSYRNRYPSMRSRRVARQEKLLNGTLRKRKQREDEFSLTDSASPHPSFSLTPLSTVIVKPAHHSKTLSIDDVVANMRYRIKIDVENVDLDDIDLPFRTANCVFPRTMNVSQSQSTNGCARWLEETLCNELGWKLAWLNQRYLENKKNLLQRVLDVYCTKFVPCLRPRKNSTRTAPIPPLTQLPEPLDNNIIMSMLPAIPLTISALSAQNARFAQDEGVQPGSPAISCTSGTTESLDFGDCFSLADEPTTAQPHSSFVLQPLEVVDPIPSPSYSSSFCDMTNESVSFCHSGDVQLFSSFDESSTIISSRTTSTSSSSTTSAACTPSPPSSSYFIGDSDIYDTFMLPPIIDDTFLDLSLSSSAMMDISMKFLDPLSSSFSNTVQQDTVKMEEIEEFSAAQFLDPLF